MTSDKIQALFVKQEVHKNDLEAGRWEKTNFK